MRRTTAVVVAATLMSIAALVSAGAAGATPPTTETETSSGTFVFEDCAVDLTVDFRRTLTTTTFYDDAGDPVRVQTHAAFVDTLTNPDTGKSVTDRDHWMFTMNLESETTTVVGLVRHINIPGHGIVVLWTGRTVFDPETDELLFEAGPHDLDSGMEELCAIMADP